MEFYPIERQMEGLRALFFLSLSLVFAVIGAMVFMAIFAHIFNLVFHEWDYEDEEDKS